MGVILFYLKRKKNRRFDWKKIKKKKKSEIEEDINFNSLEQYRSAISNYNVNLFLKLLSPSTLLY